MASVDATIVATALHPIGRSLHSTINWTAWTVTIYQLGQIVAMPLAGKVSDQFGRKNVYVLSAVVFTVSSLACGLSTSIYMLVSFRLVQAIGGGAFMPSASGIVADHFGRDRDKALAMFTSIFPIGGIVGPGLRRAHRPGLELAGDLLRQRPDRGGADRSLAIKFMPKGIRRPSASLDLVGVAMLALTILFGMLAVTTLGTSGVEPWDPRCLVPFLASCLLGTAFLRHSKRSEAPFIPVRLLLGKSFFAMNIVNIVFGTVVLGFSCPHPPLRPESLRDTNRQRRNPVDRPGHRDGLPRRPLGDDVATNRLPPANGGRVQRHRGSAWSCWP